MQFYYVLIVSTLTHVLIAIKELGTTAMSMLPRVTALAALLLPLSVSSTQMETRITGAETTGFFPVS